LTETNICLENIKQNSKTPLVAFIIVKYLKIPHIILKKIRNQTIFINFYNANFTLHILFLLIISDKPEIVFTNFKCIADYQNGNTISLRCLANSQPVPLITWYDPHGKQISSTGVSNITCGSILTLVTDDNDVCHSCRLYKCKANNDIGYDERRFTIVSRSCKSNLFMPQKSTFLNSNSILDRPEGYKFISSYSFNVLPS
jgi:hypothetical protein